MLGETRSAIRLEEAGLPPRLYIPRSDVDLTGLVRSDRRTHCPYKGDATYFDVVVDDESAEDAVWSYEDPVPAMYAITSHLCFDPSRGVVIEEE